MNQTMRLEGVLFVLVSLFALPLAWAKDPIIETDLLKIQHVTSVDVAADGSFAIYVVESVRTEPASSEGAEPVQKYQSHLWMVGLRDGGGNPVELTFGNRSDYWPAMSPDGRLLAFVRVDGSQDKQKPQVWLMPLDSPGEARQLTHLEFGADMPRWRNDGEALLVTSHIPLSRLPGKPPFPLERPGRDWWDFDRTKDGKQPLGRPDGDWKAIRNWLEQNSAEHNPDDIMRLDFLGEQSLETERSVAELFRIDLNGGEPRSTQVTQSFSEHRNAAWSPDGFRILFSALPDLSESPGRYPERSAIWIMNADGSNEHVLLKDDRYNFYAPQYTPDGKHVLALGMPSDEPTYRQLALALFDPDGARPQWLTPEDEPSVQQPRIYGDKVFYTVNTAGGQHLRSVDLHNKEIRTLIDGPVGVDSFSVGADKIVYSLVTAQDPSELYVSMKAKRAIPLQPRPGSRKTKDRRRAAIVPLFERSTAVTRRLTQLNARWLEKKDIAVPEEHWIRRPDGTRIQYWVMRPTRLQPGKKYPWILDMHGGPSVMWGPGEFSMWHEFQMFCSFGYGVVYANPRGSSGYGYAFQRANYKDWGDGPAGDVLAALEDAEAHEPSIDRTRLFLTGGSYAGYLTAWIIGHDNRFKAAVAQRGVYDLSVFFGEGNAYSLIPREFGGYPWEPDTRRLLERESPITYVDKMETPLLILHGSQDFRTGVSQSEMLFRALKQQGKPVEYVRYPGAGHELTRTGPPKQRMDHMLRIIEFFERYAKNERPAPQETVQ